VAARLAGATRRAAPAILATAFAAAVLLCFAPLPPLFASSSLDPSWQQGLHVAVEQGFAFGSQLVFTYGPLGFVHARLYWPGLFAPTIAFWVLLGLATLDAWRETARGGGGLAVGGSTLLYAALALSATYTYDAIVMAYLLPWAWSVEAAAPSRARLAAHGAMVGVIALSKLTFALGGALACAAVVVVLLLRRRPRDAAVAPAAAVLVFLAGWWLVGQRFGALPEYVLNGLEVVAGYADAMALPGPWQEKAVLAAGVAALGALVGYTVVQRRDAAMGVAAVFTLAFFALAWRQAFTRHDMHAFLAFTFGCAAAACLALRLVREGPRRAAAAGLVAVVFLFAACTSITLRGGFPASVVLGDIVHRPLRAIEGLREAGGWPARHRAAMEHVRNLNPLPPLPGSVDVYSHDQAVAFAHGLRWNPRPVFQSYSAYTARLAALNRDHLLGAAAPDHVLLRVQAIDGRLPALEDGASWLPLLERYQVREEGTFLVLDRAAAPRPAKRRELPPWRGRGWLELPRDAAMVVAALEVDEPRNWLPLRGRPPLNLEVRLAGASEPRHFRFIRSAARTPFLLSPLVENHHDLADLFLPCATGAKPAAIEALRILDSRGAEVAFTARLEAVDTVPGFPEAPGNEARDALCRLERLGGEHASPAMIGDNLGRGLNVHPPSRLAPRVPVRAIRFCTRMAAAPADAGGQSDGYVLSLWRRGADAPIASHRAEGETRFQEACVAAKFDAPAADLEIRVDPGKDARWDWVYVSRLKLDE
jgi:hypothetical protein